MFIFEWFSCPEGITPNSCLTELNNTIYIYIYVYFFFFFVEQNRHFFVYIFFS